jgi:photosystem II stability/assembly factor-like uncharacterized protein
MKRIFDSSVILLLSIGAALAGCVDRNMPTTGLTYTEPSATSTVLISTPILESTLPATQPGVDKGLTPTPEAENTPMVITPDNAQVMDMQFIDAKHGWWLGETYQPPGTWGIAIRQTVDGGAIWTPLPAPDVQPGFKMDFRSSDPNLVSQIRFVNGKTGWIFGPGLFYTQDGGKVWHPVVFSGAVVALEPGVPGKPIWAIAQVCLQIPDCTTQLFQASPDRPDQWSPVSYIPVLHPVLAFIRPDSQDGYILSNVSNESFQVSLISTHDEGQSWTSVSTGCISEQPLLAASDRSHLFLLCSGMPGAGNQSKQFYTSTDGGETWNLIQNPNAGNTLGSYGYSNALGSYGYSNALVFLTPKVGVLALGRSSLFTTQDGGRSWTWSSINNMRDASGWVLDAPGGQEIFAALWTTIYHSLDGGLTWQSSEIH